MVVRALVVPKLPKGGCCCYQRLTTACHDRPNSGMELCCVPQQALFLDRSSKVGGSFCEGQGRSQSRASVVTLVGLPKEGSANHVRSSAISARHARREFGGLRQ